MQGYCGVLTTVHSNQDLANELGVVAHRLVLEERVHCDRLE